MIKDTQMDINLTDENFFKDNLSGSTDSKTENTKDIKKSLPEILKRC